MAKKMLLEIDELKRQILKIGAMVEENLRNSYLAFTNKDVLLARQVVLMDEDVDDAEISVEEECLRILTLFQPVASDLRFVVTVLKINNDLERVGDLAAKIGRKINLLDKKNILQVELSDSKRRIPTQLDAMFSMTIKLLKQSLDAFVNEDTDLAHKILIMDVEVDEAKHMIRQEIEEIISEDASQYVHLTQMLAISRALERISDHCTNIAENVIYLHEGHIVRHDEVLRR